jgi:hypothetical protein
MPVLLLNYIEAMERRHMDQPFHIHVLQAVTPAAYFSMFPSSL